MQGPSPRSNVASTDGETSSWPDGKRIEKMGILERTDVEEAKYGFVVGWRLYLLSLSLGLCMFLVNIEVPIIGTSLTSIVKDLQGVDHMGWVVTGYLITYTALVIIWAKISDIFGRRSAIITSMLIFTTFSGACGGAQNMNQLIIFRVFQGAGAAGGWSLALTVAYEMVPKSKYPQQAALLAGATALGSLFGPIIGGGASQTNQWRWGFYFNIPAGLVTIFLLLVALPKNFPYQRSPTYKAPSWGQRLSRPSLARIDVTGSILLMSATVLLVAVLLEGGVSFAWSSATAISLFVVAGVSWILFFGNEWYFTQRDRSVEPIFPWRFVTNRLWIGTLMLSLLSAVPYNIIVINLPQRFQAVLGASPLNAAVRLLPFNFVITFSSVIINVIAGKTNIAPIWLCLFGSLLQLGGLIWFSLLPEDGTIPTTIYGCQVLTGCGIGCVMGILLQLPPRVVEKRDIAISSGALLQLRALGGALGLSIGTTILNNYLESHLSNLLGNVFSSALLQATEDGKKLPEDVHHRIVIALTAAYSLQTKILLGFAGLQILTVGMLYRHGNQIQIVETPEKK